MNNNQEVLNKQLDYTLYQIRLSGALNVAIAALITGALLQEHSLELIWPWLAYTVVAVVIRYPLFTAKHVAYMKQHPPMLAIAVIIISAMAGWIWGMALFLYGDVSSNELFMLLTITVIGYVSGALTTLGGYYKAYLSYACAAVLPLVVQFFINHDVNFAILLSVYLLGMSILCRHFNSIITSGISIDLKNVELLKDLTRAKEIAENANQSKSRFLASASHDLRQPLQSISMFIDVLLNRTEDKEQLEYLQHIADSHHSLSDLFNALLDISRLESGLLKVNIKHLQAKKLLEPVVVEMQTLAEGKGLIFHADIEDVVMKTDPVLIIRVLRNLIDNAIKYTDRGSVNLQVKEDDRNILIYLDDTGIGIPQNQVDMIYDEYFQADNHRSDKKDGVGLGLSSVKKMLDLMQHSILVRSLENQGTSFTIALPKGDPEQVEAISAFDATQSIDGVKVLLIDDEPIVRLATQTLLKDMGCEVHAISKGIEAYELINQGLEVDVILSDYRLEEGDRGDIVITSIRTLAGKDIPGIIMSGDTNIDLQIALSDKGCRLFSKPVKPEILRKAIHEMLS